MGVLHIFPPTRAHALATALLQRHSAQEIAGAIEVLIDVLDALGGDPDLEDDDPAGQCDEDGVNTALHVLAGRGAGCIIADEDCDEDGKFPTYGIDQTTPIGLNFGPGVDPVPTF